MFVIPCPEYGNKIKGCVCGNRLGCIAPVAKVWMKLACQGKGLKILGGQQIWEIFTGEETFLNLETIIVQSPTCAW